MCIYWDKLVEREYTKNTQRVLGILTLRAQSNMSWKSPHLILEMIQQKSTRQQHQPLNINDHDQANNM